MPGLESLFVGEIGTDEIWAVSRYASHYNAPNNVLSTLNTSWTDLSASTSDMESSTMCVLCDLSPLVLRSFIIFLALSSVSAMVVLLRLRTRYKRLHKLTLDDILIVVAWIFGVVAGVISHYRDSHGFGDARPSFEELSSIFLQQFVFMQFFYLTLALTQASVAIHYKRLDGGLSGKYRLCCNLLLGYIVVGSTFELLSYVFQCLPVSAFWQLLDRSDAKCYQQITNDTLLIYGPPLFRISADLALIAIPLPLVWKLCLPRQQKWGIISIICVTFISMGANLRRLILTEPDATMSIMHFLMDILPRIQVWSNIEIHSAIMCACAVTLKAPFMDSLRTLTLWLTQIPLIRGRTRKSSWASSTDDIENCSASSGLPSPRFVHVSKTGVITRPGDTPWRSRFVDGLSRAMNRHQRHAPKDMSQGDLDRERQTSVSSTCTTAVDIISPSTTHKLSPSPSPSPSTSGDERVDLLSPVSRDAVPVTQGPAHLLSFTEMLK